MKHHRNLSFVNVALKKITPKKITLKKYTHASLLLLRHNKPEHNLKSERMIKDLCDFEETCLFSGIVLSTRDHYHSDGQGIKGSSAGRPI